MKMLFWTILLAALAWWLLKNKLGAGNDLTAHLNEQRDLASIGNSALGANQIGNANWPLSFLGSSALAGISLNPFDSNSPFQQPHDTVLLPGSPSVSGAANPFDVASF